MIWRQLDISADLSEETARWDGIKHIPGIVQSLSQASFNSNTYSVPSIVAIEQIYYRKDILQAHGVSTQQPRSLDELLSRAKEIKSKTGHYALLFPAGLTWGMGSFNEGFRYLLASDANYSLVTSDGKYNLNHSAVLEALSFYEELVRSELMPIAPLLNPEPWIIPKYEMFPDGQLVATTCGTWCPVFDWGPAESQAD